jgi:hypothetical protein
MACVVRRFSRVRHRPDLAAAGCQSRAPCGLEPNKNCYLGNAPVLTFDLSAGQCHIPPIVLGVQCAVYPGTSQYCITGDPTGRFYGYSRAAVSFLCQNCNHPYLRKRLPTNFMRKVRTCIS